MTNADECLAFCQSNQNCKWFNYEPEQNNICGLTDNCTYINEDCAASNCVHGQVECQQQHVNLNVMVAVGQVISYVPFDGVEVMNTKTIESCPVQPAPYPYDVELSVALKHQNKFVICSGRGYSSTYNSDCHSYDFINDKWELEPFKLEPERIGAMSVEIRSNEWLIMGGYDRNHDTLSDTQLFNDGKFIPGPQLPTPIFFGCAVMLDEERLFVSGGSGTERNFFLDINTNQWAELAQRSYLAWEGASCGTFYNSSVDEIQLAHIGVYGIEIYSPSKNAWHTFPMPPDISTRYYAVTIQQGPNAFIMIGGTTGNEFSGDINHFDQTGLKLIKERALTTRRRYHVALPIPEDQFTC